MDGKSYLVTSGLFIVNGLQSPSLPVLLCVLIWSSHFSEELCVCVCV